MSSGLGRVVIVGAGHAGSAAAAALRQFGWAGRVTLIGEEPLPPYQRPPLSKAWLKGDADFAGLLLRPAAFYPANAIELRLSERVVRIDRPAKAVRLITGEAIRYDCLILALGAAARPLNVPGAALRGVLALRSVPDAEALRRALRRGVRLVVIGGGYIGLEVAASARVLGAEVTVIERESRVLSRVACPALSDFFAREHVARGVRLECGAAVEALEGAGGAVAGARLSDGRLLAADLVLVGVGAGPNQTLAREAALACDDGIVVNERARSSDPNIFAIGDCARRPLPLYGRTMRLESVPNALEMAKQAAAALCGRGPPVPEVPWFWSDQYELRLQIAGLPFDVAQTVSRGNPETGGFALFHLTADDMVRAVEAVNAAPEFMAGKTMIARLRRVAAERLRDPRHTLQELAS